jgi:hypothetical protein
MDWLCKLHETDAGKLMSDTALLTIKKKATLTKQIR